MVDRDNLYSKSPTQNPTVQRSTPFGGVKLHFSYTGKEIKTSSSREGSSQPKLPGASSSRLLKQSTFDDSQRTQPSALLSPGIPRRSTYVSSDLESGKKADEPTLYEPRSNSSQYSHNAANFYGDASFARISHPIKDVTLATSSTLVPPLLSQHTSTQSLKEAPPPAASPRRSQYSAYSSYDPSKKITAAVLSPQAPAPPPVSPRPTASAQNYYPRTSPSPRAPSPPKSVLSPRVNVPSYLRRAPSPNRRDPSPPRRVFSPPIREPSPVRRVHSPPRRVPSPIRRHPSPPRRVIPAPTRELSPVRRLHSPPRRAPSPNTAVLSPSKSLYLPSVRQFSPVRRVSPPRRAPSPIRRSPSPAKRSQPAPHFADHRSRRQTTTFLAPVASPHTYQPEQNFGLRQSRYIPAAPDPFVQTPKPHSLNSQMQNTRLASPRRNNLTIGYSANQFQEIEKAQEEFKALARKNEEAIRAKLEAKRKADEEARLAQMRRIEEASKLEARRRVEETARLEAERLALEAMMRAAEPADEDEDVAKFIHNLEQRIKDSRDSKNSMGALVGRQLNQNLAKSAENLTNAPNEVAEVVEGRDTNDQVSTQSAADNSEFAVFIERLNSMTTDENQNRRKYAENYYDPEEDDSELNSLNSFLSTVTEEDPDMLSINNQPFTVDPQPTTLQPCVISYIHDMVDGILSSLDKTDFENADTHKMPPLYDQDLYANDSTYNYRAMSETARQFFTPQSSPVEDTKNSFYNDSL